jgi:GNAT superfamily N-acetyltransferase
MSVIDYRPYRADDEPGLRDLFRAVYGPDADRRTSAWRYLAPAPYPAVIQIAETGGRIVGAQPAHGIDLLICGDPVKGLLLLDVMTHPEYRRRGILKGVVEGLRERAAAEGYRVLLTTPNRDAEHGFARLPAWTRMGELVPWVGIGDAATLLAAGGRAGALLRPFASPWRRLTRHRHAETADETTRDPGDRFTAALWTATTATAICQLVRDTTFMSWRFGTGSGRPYTFSGAGTADQPEALAVSGVGRFIGRDVVTLVDLVAPPGSTAAGAHLLRTLAARAARERRAAVVGWFAPGSGAENVLRRAGFIRVPKLLRPRPYSVWGACDLPERARQSALTLHSWSMSLADSDLA